jgi:hypothetical protein
MPDLSIFLLLPEVVSCYQHGSTLFNLLKPQQFGVANSEEVGCCLVRLLACLLQRVMAIPEYKKRVRFERSFEGSSVVYSRNSIIMFL